MTPELYGFHLLLGGRGGCCEGASCMANGGPRFR